MNINKKVFNVVIVFIIGLAFPFWFGKAMTQDEIEKNYKKDYNDLFESNSSCTYKFDGSSNPLGFSQFRIIFTKTEDKKDKKVKLDIYDNYYYYDSEYETLGFHGDSVTSHVDQGWHRIDALNPPVRINTGNFDYKSLLNQLKTNNSCLKHVYFCRDRTYQQEHEFALSIYGNGECQQFTDINAHDEPNGCNKNDAKSCKKYNKTVAGENFEIEIGITTKDKKYFIFKNQSVTHESDPLFSPPQASWSGAGAKVINNNVYPSVCTDSNCEWPNDIYVIHTCLGENDYYYITLPGASYNSSNIDGTISEEKCYVEQNPLDPPTIRDPESEFTPSTPSQRLDYTSWCSTSTDGNKGIRSAFKIIGYIIAIAKWIVPMILIVFGIVDYAKATVSEDEKALSKATSSFIKRVIAGLAVFIVPILIRGFVNVLEETRDSLSTEEAKSNFAACTKCLFDPFNSCN